MASLQRASAFTGQIVAAWAPADVPSRCCCVSSYLRPYMLNGGFTHHHHARIVTFTIRKRAQLSRDAQRSRATQHDACATLRCQCFEMETRTRRQSSKVVLLLQ